MDETATPYHRISFAFERASRRVVSRMVCVWWLVRFGR